MNNKTKCVLTIACLVELIASFIVWSLRMEFNYANRITCAIFICLYVLAVVLGICGFFSAKKILFVICALIPVLFCGGGCLMQLIGGGFPALFNEIFLPRVIIFATCVAIFIFVVVYSRLKKEE